MHPLHPPARLRVAWPALLLALVLAACATPYLQPAGEALHAPALFADHVRTADGVRLPLSVWRPADAPRAVVLALHGFNDYRRSFEETGAFLAARGLVVYAYDQRGFGATDQAGLWPGVERMVADLHGVVGLLRARHPDRPLYLLGESMGGALALHALSGSDPPRIDGVALLAPAVRGRATIPLLQRGLLWLLAHTVPAAHLSPRGLDIRATDNDNALRKLREDPLVIKDTRVDALWGLVGLMDLGLASRLPPGLPGLILYGAQDRLIPREATCLWLSAQPQTARLAVYPQGWHMLTRDLHAETVLGDLAAWLAEPTAPLPSGAEVSGRKAAFCPAAK